jgi:Uma2 family endonuclease
MATKTTLTWEQFLAAGKADQRWEYIGGEIWFMPPGGFEQGRAIHKISAALGALDTQEWVCLGTDVAFTMAGGDWLCPDAAAVRAARFGGPISDGPVPFPPDVAFEVLSREDKVSHVERKRYLYYLNKVIQVWVDPYTKTVEVVSLNRPVRYFGPEDTVAIEELPGFRTNLFPLWPA